MSLRMKRWLRWLAAFAALFAFGLVMFGAFVRLSNAGLPCPDWPTCYGQVTWPQHAQAVAHADAAFPGSLGAVPLKQVCDGCPVPEGFPAPNAGAVASANTVTTKIIDFFISASPFVGPRRHGPDLR